MTELEQYFRCCLDPAYYLQMKSQNQIKFSDRYFVEHLDHWTREPLRPEEIMASPGFFPGVKGFYPANRSTEKQARQECRNIFDELEANCNTCRLLQRRTHSKHPQGFLFGICSKTQEDLIFHPDDPLDKKCYERRTT